MFDQVVILLALIAIAVVLWLWRRDRDQSQSVQQQVDNTRKALSDTRRRTFASLCEDVELRSSELAIQTMRHIAEESAQQLSDFAQRIGGNSGSAAPNNSNGDGGGSGGGGARTPQSSSPSSTSSQPINAHSARPHTAVPNPFRPTSGSNQRPAAAEDTEVYIKAIEAISQLYHKRTQQAVEDRRRIID